MRGGSLYSLRVPTVRVKCFILYYIGKLEIHQNALRCSIIPLYFHFLLLVSFSSIKYSFMFRLFNHCFKSVFSKCFG